MSTKVRRFAWDTEVHRECLEWGSSAWGRLLGHVRVLCQAEHGLTPFERDRVRASVTDLLWQENMRRMRERPSAKAVPAYVRVLVRNEARKVRKKRMRLVLEAQLTTGQAAGSLETLRDERVADPCSAETRSAPPRPSLPRAELLRRCRRHLTPLQMQVVERRLADLSYAAIGRALGRTEDAVKKTWQAALRRLRRSASPA